MVSETQKKNFTYTPSSDVVQDTILCAAHSRRIKTSRFAPFAGYRMPLWFSSIRDEHRAVREAAGLFDCTHMGVFSIQGAHAESFLNAITTNDVTRLQSGQAQYATLLDSNAFVIDDIIVYCRVAYDYLMVVNAANKDKVKAWFDGLVKGDWLIDPDQPDRVLELAPKIQDLSELPDNQALVDIAIQGPNAGTILAEVTENETAIQALKSFHFVDVEINGTTCFVARTGYTGAKTGFELFVPRSHAEELWELLLERGGAAGLLPCGLGARDSLRIEAGFPLYGHELAGPHAINPIEAGYPWAVKFKKDFFIGKAALQEQVQQSTRQVVRLSLPGERGVRPVRMEDAVVSQAGQTIGWILSSVTVADQQIALACIDQAHAAEGTPLGIYYLARNERQIEQGRLKQTHLNDSLTPDIQGKTIARFSRF